MKSTNPGFEQPLKESIANALASLYQVTAEPAGLVLQETRKEFEGDTTFVVFPFTAQSRKSPEATAQELGEALLADGTIVAGFNVVKGFLNIVLHNQWWMQFLNHAHAQEEFGRPYEADDSLVMVEYSSPNTNKPLHLGHIRNNLLGFAVTNILEFAGHGVIKTCIVNDRGVHISKSMLAWQLWGNGETPENTGIKGDHLVGKYYVKFDQEYRTQIASLTAGGMAEEQAKKEAPLMQQIQQMLVKWEQEDEEVRTLWKKMNGWVYNGFEETYRNLGVDFDTTYYESDTYVLGKDIVQEGVDKGVFYKKEDGSVWVDLTDDGLDHKLLLRADGTSVYITQDLGTAQLRFEKEPDTSKLVYVVGNEQDYHFKVLALICKKLGKEWADKLYHLSYAMVDLPSGKMKSREGTVVDADDLMAEMLRTARETTLALGKLVETEGAEAEALYTNLGMGALKYYILKVNPQKRMLFNPEESIDFQGNTGPFIQYTYARIMSIMRKTGAQALQQTTYPDYMLNEKEKEVVKQLYKFPAKVEEAAKHYDPSVIAGFAYDVAKSFNQFYHEHSILQADTEVQMAVRLQLAQQVSYVLSKAMELLGIQMPERM